LGGTLIQGPKIQSRHYLSPQKKLRHPKLNYEAPEISEVGGPFERKVLVHEGWFTLGPSKAKPSQAERGKVFTLAIMFTFGCVGCHGLTV